MKPKTRKPSIELLEDRINLDSSIQFFNLGALTQTGGRFGTFNLGYFNQGEIITLKSNIPSSSWAGGGVATGLNVNISNTVALDYLDWIDDIGRYSVINTGNISLSYGVTRTGADEAYGSISLISKTPAANLKPNIPVINPDGSIDYSYRLEGPAGSQIAYRGYVELELYYAVGPNRSDIRERIASHTLESNPGTWSFIVPKEVVQNSYPKEPRSHIVAIIDKDNLAAESTDNDNIASIALPNLVILPPKLSADGNVKVGYRIDGGPIKTNDISIWLYWSDSKTWDGDCTFIKKIAIDPKAVGDKWIENAISGSQLDSAPSGKPYLLARLDPLGNYVESNESDNTGPLVLPDINLKDATYEWNSLFGHLTVTPKIVDIPFNCASQTGVFWAKGPKKSDIIDPIPFETFGANRNSLYIKMDTFTKRPINTTHIVFVGDYEDILKELSKKNNIFAVRLRPGNIQIINKKTNKVIDHGVLLDFGKIELRKTKLETVVLKNIGTPNTILDAYISIDADQTKGDQDYPYKIVSINGKKCTNQSDFIGIGKRISIRGGKSATLVLQYVAPIPEEGLFDTWFYGFPLKQDIYGTQKGNLNITTYDKSIGTDEGLGEPKKTVLQMTAFVNKPSLKIVKEKIKLIPEIRKDLNTGISYPTVTTKTYYKSSTGNIRDFEPRRFQSIDPFAIMEHLSGKTKGIYGTGQYDGARSQFQVWSQCTVGGEILFENNNTITDGHGLNFDPRMLGPNSGKIFIIDWTNRLTGTTSSYHLKEVPLQAGQLTITQNIYYSVDFDSSKAEFTKNGSNVLVDNGYQPNLINMGIKFVYTRSFLKINNEWWYKINVDVYDKNGSKLDSSENKMKIEELRRETIKYYTSSPTGSSFNPANGLVFFDADSGIFRTEPVSSSFFSSKAQIFNEASIEFGNTNEELYASLISLNSKNVILTADSTSQIQGGIEVYYKKSSDSNWSIKNGFASGSNEFQISSLSKNTNYQFKITVTMEDGSVITSDTIDFQTEVDPPDFPHDFATSRILKDAVFLKWTDSSNDETGFLITQSNDNGKSWEEIDLIGKNKTGYKVSDLNPNSDYQFRVYAVNGEVKSDSSRTLKVKTLKDIPKTPENLHFSEIRNNSVVVRWDDKSNDETGFRIAMSSDGGHTWTTLPNLVPNSEKFQVTGLKANRKYQFKVRALGANDASPFTSSETVQTDPNPPKAPTNLRVDSPNYNRLNLRWNDNSNDEDQFEISMSTNGGKSWKTIDYAKRDKTSYVVNNLYEETAYQFRIRSIGDGSESAWSEIAKGTTTSSKPDIPLELKATDVDLNTFKLSWKAAKGAISRYEVQILGDEGWQLSENVGKNFTSAKIEYERRGGSKLKSNTQYQVRLVAISENGRSSDATNPIFVKTDSKVPAAPESIKSSSVTAKTFSISWSSTSKYVDHFEVYVQSGGTWQLSENVNKDLRSAKIEYELAQKVYLKPETDYKVRVRAIGLAPELDAGPWSEIIPVQTGSLRPSVPEGLKLGSVSTNKFEISWKHSGDKLNKFQVQVQTDGVWHISEDVGSSFRSATIEHEVANGASIQSDKTYNVRIRAVNKDGNDFINSDWSEPISVTTDTLKPKIPEGLKLTSVATNKFEISWKHSGDKLNKFQVQVQTDGVWHISEDVGSSFRSATIEHEVANGASIKSDKTYNVRIRAVNKDGNDFINSDWSESISVTTDTLKPKIPEGLKLTSVSTNKFGISWKHSGDKLNKFQVQVQTDGVWHISEDVGPTFRDALIEHEVANGNNLRPNKTYNVRIRAVNKEGSDFINSDWSDPISVATESNTPETPYSVSVSNIGLNSFDISWKCNGNNVTKFEVWVLTGTKWNKSEPVPADRRSAQIQYEVSGGSRLQEDTSYSVKIIAINDDKNNPSQSDFSQPVDLKTTTLRPHSPSGLKATIINKTSFVITWNDNDKSTSNRNETKFEVHISKDGVNYNHSEDVPKDLEKATIEYEVTYNPRNIKKIKANTKYWVIIYAVNGHGKTLMTGSPLVLTTDK